MEKVYRSRIDMHGDEKSPDVYRIHVTPCQESGRHFIQIAHQLGISGLKDCHASRLYFLKGWISEDDIRLVATNLLADPVSERWVVGEEQLAGEEIAVEVTLHPGVTDPPAENLVRAAHGMGITGLDQAATGHHYRLEGALSATDLHRLASEILANPVIHHVAINQAIEPPFVASQPPDDTVEIFSMREATDEQLRALSKERRLALDLAEMRAIRDYYRREEREPTDVELETLAQTWSEHCVHKTFRSAITYVGPDGEIEEIDGLLKTYIRAATEKVNKPWVQSAFVDNAGIVAFDEQFDLAFKVETHNHPSALEPFGGANTGVGGVVRDVLGVSARPIANTDVLCFGPPDLSLDELPAGVLHPRRIADGVVAGVEDYGNKMGIPTVNGAILYHPGYTANPLVFCGCLGILPRGSHPTKAQSGDLIVAVGGRTGRDGLRGATFSSMEMNVETGQVAGTAVQIGHPIMEKQVQEVVLRARDEKLYTAITDCGAGGFSSAVGEMGEKLGARVQLQNAKLKYPGLRPWEIWLSEAQERMVLAVPPEHWVRLQDLCAKQDIEAIQLGEFTGDGRLRIHYGDQCVADLSMAFLHGGLPRRHLNAEWQPQRVSRFPAISGRSTASEEQTASTDLESVLLALLAHPDIRSKEAVIRHYDHEVQGGMAIKPLVGVGHHGPSDAAVLVPANSLMLSDLGSLEARRVRSGASLHSAKGVALSNGIRPGYTHLDPYCMAWASIDEAFRNVTAVGADPDQVALLDNFSWGNPSLSDRLGALVRCAQGCYDAAIAFNAPFISGKDSLNNEYLGNDGRKHAIPGTLLISALGIVPNVTETVTMDLKHPGNLLFVVGETRAELGGSHYELCGGQVRPADDSVPHPVENALVRMRSVHKVIQAGLVQSCHDCSEGGLAVTLAEMALAGGLGAETSLDAMPLSGTIADDVMLFSETLSRFVVEVQPGDVESFKEMMTGQPHALLGKVGGDRLRIFGRASTLQGSYLIDLPVKELEVAWRGENGMTDVGSSSNGNLAARDRQGASRLRSREQSGSKERARRNSETSPRILILHANGTNRDRDAALACELAGGRPEIVHVNQLLAGERQLLDYHMLVVPGGFSYGDDLGAGLLWSRDLQSGLGDDVRRFVDEGRPVIGICNGFQALVKAGILPGLDDHKRSVTLTFNESGRFECRWVWLQPNPHSPSLFTDGLEEPILCPVAHGEGRLVVGDEATLTNIRSQHLVPLTYVNEPAAGAQSVGYPANPNGSMLDAAALCNRAGNVLGLMPHPENHVLAWQHPRRHRGERGGLGLRLFANGIRNA